MWQLKSLAGVEDGGSVGRLLWGRIGGVHRGAACGARCGSHPGSPLKDMRLFLELHRSALALSFEKLDVKQQSID